MQVRVWRTPPTLGTNSLSHSPLLGGGGGPPGPRRPTITTVSSPLELVSSTAPECPTTLNSQILHIHVNKVLYILFLLLLFIILNIYFFSSVDRYFILSHRNPVEILMCTNMPETANSLNVKIYLCKVNRLNSVYPVMKNPHTGLI